MYVAVVIIAFRQHEGQPVLCECVNEFSYLSFRVTPLRTFRKAFRVEAIVQDFSCNAFQIFVTPSDAAYVGLYI